MDFFNQQKLRRRRSLWLYGLFFCVVGLHVAVALAVLLLLNKLFGSGSVSGIFVLLVALLVVGSFALGSWAEYRRQSDGGRAIARRVGAVRLFVDTSRSAWGGSSETLIAEKPIAKTPTDEQTRVRYSSHQIAVRHESHFPTEYRRFYEFAQQMAIASGIKTPLLYVLPEEMGINALVAGRHDSDMVLVLTQGALEKLSDDGLYGLIAHEYGHILHGEAHFNLHLMVVLAGLQLIYDMTDVQLSRTTHLERHKWLEKKHEHQQQTAGMGLSQAATAHFTNREQWVAHWRRENQKALNAHREAKFYAYRNNRLFDFGMLGMLVHGLTASSMGCAQLIKHSFNREREYLADAVSVQLTRSPAVIETLKSIHQDSLGSRLSYTPETKGLSHFFFASSEADIGDESWYATHPSVMGRIRAINEGAYAEFVLQTKREKRLNQALLDEIYEQRRQGVWGQFKKASSDNQEQEIVLEFTPSEDIIIDGRLQVIPMDELEQPLVMAATLGAGGMAAKNSGGNPNANLKGNPDSNDGNKVRQPESEQGKLRQAGFKSADKLPSNPANLLYPQQAKKDSDLPKEGHIRQGDVNKVVLPQVLSTHLHHPLGMLALVEAVMRCHAAVALDVSQSVDIASLYYNETARDLAGLFAADSAPDLLPHRLDKALLVAVSAMDRRLDSGVLLAAISQISKQKLDAQTLQNLKHQSEMLHTHDSEQRYRRVKKYRTVYLQYKKGLERFTAALANAGNKDLASDSNDSNLLPATVMTLWRALHLDRLLHALNQAVDEIAHPESFDDDMDDGASHLIEKHQRIEKQKLAMPDNTVSQVLEKIWGAWLLALKGLQNLARNAGSTKVRDEYQFANWEWAQLLLTAYGVRINVCHDVQSDDDTRQLLRRLARLVDVRFAALDDEMLDDCLIMAQRLDTMDMLALLQQCDVGEMDYTRWLSCLHTVLLSDTMVCQNEYDCLTLLAERWLGKRLLID